MFVHGAVWRIVLVAVASLLLMVLAYVAVSHDWFEGVGSRIVFDSRTIVTIASLLIAFVSLGLSFFLYRGRRVAFTKGEHALMPEAWLPTLQDVSRGIQGQTDLLKKLARHLIDTFSVQSKEMSDIKDMLGKFRQALDKKDEEIERYKKGYDQQVFVKFLRRFAKLQKVVDESIKGFEQDSSQAKKGLDNIKELLSYALVECDVVAFSPKVGEDWTKLAKDEVEDNPVTIPTNDPQQDQIIAEVVSVGYKLDNTETPVFIVPARVKIYVYQSEESS